MLSNEGSYITPNDRKQTIRLWKSSNWELLRTIDIIQTNKLVDDYKNIISWSPDGDFLPLVFLVEPSKLEKQKAGNYFKQ
jgi:WD40 repeat protein